MVDMIIQNVGRQGLANLSFTVPTEDAFRAEKALKEHFADVNGGKLGKSTNIIKVSVVGVGMRSHSGVAATFFDALAEAGINMLMISTLRSKWSRLNQTTLMSNKGYPSSIQSQSYLLKSLLSTEDRTSWFCRLLLKGWLGWRTLSLAFPDLSGKVEDGPAFLPKSMSCIFQHFATDLLRRICGGWFCSLLGFSHPETTPCPIK